ncbi:MAG: BlaI/MecI/CopY family transcriptional regulator, partial [Planctomycetota bacterium]
MRPEAWRFHCPVKETALTQPPSRRSRRPAALPRAELEVMACLWEGGPATARRIRETMHDYRPMAHGSVMVLLK